MRCRWRMWRCARECSGGLESGGYVSGRYAPSVEHAMHAMHQRYYHHIFGDGNEAEKSGGEAGT